MLLKAKDSRQYTDGFTLYCIARSVTIALHSKEARCGEQTCTEQM